MPRPLIGKWRMEAQVPSSLGASALSRKVVWRQAAWSGRATGLLGEDEELRFSWAPEEVDLKPSFKGAHQPLPPRAWVPRGPHSHPAQPVASRRPVVVGVGGAGGVGGQGWVNAATL